LRDTLGKQVTSGSLLGNGPIVITFYRGEWCPICNLALHHLQKHLDEFAAKGVQLVAISPMLPDLKFTVLSDEGNKYAKQLGILFPMPDTLRPVFDKFGHNLKRDNGDDSFVVPVPATFLVDQKGIVRNAFVDTDYTKRVEPATILEWIDALKE
jgi:peroxiredoxin